MENYFKHKMRGKNPMVIAGMILFGIVAIVGLAILFGFVIMWLWNWLMPDLFGLPSLTYWQAVGLFILFKILIGGCGGRGKGRHSKKCHGNDSCEPNKKSKRDFSKWEHYDKFWEEKGDKAYAEYVSNLNKPNEPTPPSLEEENNSEKTES